MIIANSIVLAMDRSDIDQSLSSFIKISNNVFFGFFATELVLKLMSEGFKFYLRDHYNWLDCFVIVVSTIDIALENTTY
jgi:hypothetical protein